MSFISQKLKQRLTFRELLIQKIKALRQVHRENQNNLNYVEAHFILHKKSIKRSVIHFILKQLYQSQFEKVLQNWNAQIIDDKFIEDVFYIKRKVVDEQWISERMKTQKLLEKQYKIKSYLEPSKNETSINQRLKILKDELSIVQNKINMAKKQQQSLVLVKEYKGLKQQQNFLKNKKRRLKSLQQQRRAESAFNQNCYLDSSIEEKVNKYLQENIKNKYIKATRYTEVSKEEQNFSQLITQDSKSQISKLEKIFLSFAKKQGKQSMLFGEIQNSQNYISLENFLRMIGQTSIDSFLTLEQRVNIFKVNAMFEKKINFNNFINSLIQIAKKTSDKLKVKFDTVFLNNFLETFVKKAKQNYKHFKYEFVQIQGKKNTDYLRVKKPSKYKFQLRSHTGKMLNSISEQLADRKKVKYQKFKRLKDQSAKNSPIVRKESLKTTLTPIYQQKEVNIENKFSIKLFDPTNESKFTLPAKNFQKDTYLNIFRRKKQLKKNQDNQDLLKHNLSSFQRVYESSEADPNIQIKQKNKEAQDLQRFFQIQVDDTFLTNHLNKIPVYQGTLKNDKKNQKIHY